jgi:hypothetical protein
VVGAGGADDVGGAPLGVKAAGRAPFVVEGAGGAPLGADSPVAAPLRATGAGGAPLGTEGASLGVMGGRERGDGRWVVFGGASTLDLDGPG